MTLVNSLKKLNRESTEYAISLKKKMDSLNNEVLYYQLHFAKSLGNIYGFYKLVDFLLEEKERRIIPIDTLKEYCTYFQLKYPNHPYSEISKYRLDAFDNIKIGGHFTDIIASDSSGKVYNLSRIIYSNKVTLIDLWAPWCGPCIRKSKKMIPVYRKYNNMGFEIFAVVGGIKSKGQFINAITLHSYPWIVTSDINSRNNIWEKYGIAKSGGKQFLVNNKGIIISINPLPLEIEEIMNSGDLKSKKE